MKTGKHLKIQKLGDNVLGVKLKGHASKPEPIHFRVVFPFGDVDIVRTTDNEYWVHVRCEHEKDGLHIPGVVCGKFVDARIDLHGQHAGIPDVGDFGNPDMYHMAVRVGNAKS
jgi:hypothetical protein